MEKLGALIIRKHGLCDSSKDELVMECLGLRAQGAKMCSWVERESKGGGAGGVGGRGVPE